MPIIRASNKLIYFAHVPKCGGSAVEDYLRERFGALAFEDRQFLSVPEQRRWTRTSPQHIDIAARDRLFPAGFFDHSFAVVRHPVDRIVSAYHFQLEVERTIPVNVSFGDWLFKVSEELEDRPSIYDNHLRPMADIVPVDAVVFRLENGLDALVPWFDDVTGEKTGPRAVGVTNKRGERVEVKSEKVVPTKAELAFIEKMYERDFERFGYENTPFAEEPVRPDGFVVDRNAGSPRGNSLARKLAHLSHWVRFVGLRKDRWGSAYQPD